MDVYLTGIIITIVGILMVISFFSGAWVAYRCKENKPIVSLPEIQNASHINEKRLKELEKKGYPEI